MAAFIAREGSEEGICGKGIAQRCVIVSSGLMPSFFSGMWEAVDQRVSQSFIRWNDEMFG